MTSTSDFVKYITEAIESDGALYRQQMRPQVVNLARKKVKGIYQKELAIKLVIYLAESGIKKFRKEFCEYYEVPVSMFSRVPATVKRAIAVRLLQDMTPEIDYEVKELRAAAKKKGKR
jgi:hypothetical protein